MMRKIRLLLVLMLLTAGRQAHAQTIDSFHVNRTVTPHELFVRLQFPDSGYHVERTFHRVALIYPPYNVVSFFYRSCPSIKASPLRDTLMPLFTPEPYGLQLWLVRDSNSTPGCTLVGQMQSVDSASYHSQQTGVAPAGSGPAAIYIFPNPAKGMLHIRGASGCELRLSDGLGRLQLRQQLPGREETVDVSPLTPGLYYVQCYQNGLLLQSWCFSKLP